MRWCEFEGQAPRLAVVGCQKLNRKVAYLAVLKKDGSPIVHPVTPFIGGGMLFMFTEPSSPKIRDLRRDGRYALHCSVERGVGEPLTEFLVLGTAQVIRDRSVWAIAKDIAASPVLTNDYVLFEFSIDHALLIEYDHAGNRTVHKWGAGKNPCHLHSGGE